MPSRDSRPHVDRAPTNGDRVGIGHRWQAHDSACGRHRVLLELVGHQVPQVADAAVHQQVPHPDARETTAVDHVVLHAERSDVVVVALDPAVHRAVVVDEPRHPTQRIPLAPIRGGQALGAGVVVGLRIARCSSHGVRVQRARGSAPGAAVVRNAPDELDGWHERQEVAHRLVDVEHVRALHGRDTTRPRRSGPAVVVAHCEDAFRGARCRQTRQVVAGRPGGRSGGRAHGQVGTDTPRHQRGLELPHERGVLAPQGGSERFEVKIHAVGASAADGCHDVADEPRPVGRAAEEGCLGIRGGAVPGHHRHREHDPIALPVGGVDHSGHGGGVPAVPTGAGRRQASVRARGYAEVRDRRDEVVAHPLQVARAQHPVGQEPEDLLLEPVGQRGESSLRRASTGRRQRNEIDGGRGGIGGRLDDGPWRGDQGLGPGTRGEGHAVVGVRHPLDGHLGRPARATRLRGKDATVGKDDRSRDDGLRRARSRGHGRISSHHARLADGDRQQEQGENGGSRSAGHGASYLGCSRLRRYRPPVRCGMVRISPHYPGPLSRG